jgi:hypothetical protein
MWLRFCALGLDVYVLGIIMSEYCNTQHQAPRIPLYLLDSHEWYLNELYSFRFVMHSVLHIATVKQDLSIRNLVYIIREMYGWFLLSIVMELQYVLRYLRICYFA